MKPTATHHSLASCLGLILTSLCLQQSVRADVQTWWGNGATANWSDASGNWTNTALAASVPANGDYLIFANATQTTSSDDLSGLSVSAVTFTVGDFDFLGDLLTLTGGITNTAGDNIFDLPLTLNGTQTFEVDGGSLTLNQGITNGSSTLTFAGAGGVNLNGQVSGAGSLIMSGTGTLLVTNRQPLTGGIVVNSGTLQVSTPGNLDFGGALTPSLITVNTNGTAYGTTTHAIGGGTAIFINRGTWMLDDEDYKQNLTMWDGTIEPGPNPNSSGGELRVGFAGGAGSYVWYVTNSVNGSTISSPLNTIGSTVNLTLDVARGAAASDLTISGIIKNPGNITVVRNGITTLSGNNSQSGTFTIAGGTVVLSGPLLSSVITVASNTVFDISQASFSLSGNQTLAGSGSIPGTLYDNNAASGEVLSPGGNNVVGTLTMGGMSLNGNTTLNFDLANTTGIGGSINDLLIVTNLSLASGSTNYVNINFVNGTPLVGGTYTLIQYTAGPPAGPVTTLAAAASRYTYSFSSDGSSIKVTVTGAPGNLVWTGDNVANNWDINTSSNWLLGAASSAFLQGDNATFNDSGSVNPPVNIVGAVQPSTVTVNSTKNYVFSGSGNIASGRLVKSNSGNLTILTPNTTTSGGSLNGSGTVTVGSGGPVAANLGSGPMTNNTAVTFFETASVTYAGNMSGTGSLTSFMPGATLTLGGTNTFTGGLVVANGTVLITNLPGGRIAGPITNYASLVLSRSDAFTNQGVITSAGNTREYGNGDLYVRGAGGMTVDGTAPISLGGTLNVGYNLFGQLTINPGANFTVANTMNLGDNPSVAGSSGVVIQNGGTLNVNGYGTVKILSIGLYGSEISYYSMFGGTLNVPNAVIDVGSDGIGLLTQTNGTINCTGLSIDNNGATAAIGGTNSTFTMTGGQLNLGVNGISGNTATNAMVHTVILSGGTIAATDPAGWSSVFNLWLTNGSPTFDTTNTTITLSGGLSGNGGLTKQGGGYLNLNNATNSYTGTTTVAAGTLQGSGTIVSLITVNSGANLSAGGTLATGTLTTSNVTVNAGGSLVIDASSTATTSDLLYIQGALALNNNPLVFNFLGGTPYTGGAYTILSNLVARSGSLVYNNSTRYAATLDQTQPNRVQVSFSGTNANLVWQGNVSSNWNVNTDANWLNAGVADKYYQSDAVIFDNSGSSQSNIYLSALVTPARVAVDTSGNYTLSGSPIAGTATLTKSGSGTLTLLNSNSYSGITTIAGGTLQLGNGGKSGSLTTNCVVDNYGSLVFNNPTPFNFNGAINGPGSLTQAGSGTLLITATQNHYGGTTINNGSTVQLGNGPLADSGSLGNGPVTNNGAVIFNRAANVSVAAAYTGAGSLTFLGTGYGGTTGYILNGTNTFTGPVTLSLARIQSGAGAYGFGSPSSITVNAGSQVYAVATPFSSLYNIPLVLSGTGWADGLGALRIENGGTWAGPINLASNARIGVNNATTNLITGTITGNYELESYGGSATAALILSPSTANTYNALRVSIGTAGAKTIAGNANAIPNNIPLTMNGGTLQLNGYSKTFSAFYNLSSSSSIQNGSAISPANVTLTPVLGGSSYSGTFADGGPGPLNVTLTQTPGQWGWSLTTASPNWTGNFTNSGGFITNGLQNTGFGSQSVIGRNIVGNNGATFVTTINNVLAGYNGNLMLNNSTWICNRYISFAPNAGYLYLANSMITGTNGQDSSYENMQLPSTVLVRGTKPSYLSGIGASSAFDLQSGGTTFDVADVTGNASSDLIVGGTPYNGYPSTSFLHAPAATSSGGSMTKSGAGTMELDGANAYTWGTTISQGTLTLGASASLKSSPISIASGATFDVSAISGGLTLIANQIVGGSGTVNGSLTDAAGTAIQPGSAGTAGTLTINNNLTLTGAGALTFGLSNNTGSADGRVVVGGTLNLAPASTPTPVNFNFFNGAPALGTPYTIIQCIGTISGTAATAFTNTTRYGAVFGQTANTITVTFSGSTSNLVWTGTDPAIPATWDVATSTNWFNGSSSDVYYQSDAVRFDDTSLNNTVTLGVSVTPAGVTVDSTNNYTISGSGGIAGTTGIIKDNTNTLFLATANTFTGPIVINAGKVADGKNSTEVLAAGVNVVVSNNAAFDWNGGSGNYTTYGHTFVIAGAGPDGNGALLSSVDNGGEFSYVSISNLILTADSVIGGIERWDIGSDPNSLLNGQGHQLTISGTGNGKIDIRSQFITNVTGIVISNPVTFYESFNQTNSWTLSTTNFVKAGSRLGVYGGFQFNLPVELDGGTMTNQGGGTPIWLSSINVASNSSIANVGAQIFSGVMGGAGGIGVGGIGTPGLLPSTVTFSNASTFTGGTIISNAPVTKNAATAVSGFAAIVLASSNALGFGPITFDLSQMTTNASTNVARVLECNLSGGGVIPNNLILPAITTGVTNVGIQGHDSTSIFTLSGQITGGFSGLTNWMDFGDASSSGVMRLANPANSFLGNIYGDRGVLAITGDGCLGNAANTLKLDQATVNGGLRFDAPGINVAHGIIVNSTASLDVYGDNDGDGVPEVANSATISGVLSGGGAFTVRCGVNVIPSSYGTLTLNGNNSFTAALTVNPFVKVIAANANALGTTAGGTTVSASGTLSLNLGGTYASEPLTLTGGGVASGVGALENLSGNNVFNGTIALGAASTIGLTAGNLTLGGVLSGAYPLTITSASAANTLTLSATESYSAGTFINGGTVLVNGSLPVGNAVSIAPGAVLGGSGTINGPVSVQPGATLQPGGGGATVGKLFINNTLNLAGNTIMYLNKSTPTNSQIAGLSAVVYGGTLTVNSLGGTYMVGDKFTLFSAGDHQGSFATITLPVLAGGLVWNTNSLAVDGSIQVASTVNTNPTNIVSSVSGGTLTLSWPADHTGWRLLVQTNNLSSGVSRNLNDWATVSGSAATNSVSLPLDPTKSAEFYELVYP